jgi:BirA family transcriptional regulator, biotin operon repressor / biotin---[acetyl-CoA-carboxylase] ligase
MTWLGQRIERRGRVASTNDEAGLLARAGAPHGTVILADEQSAGRGRYGRSWHSPPGENLYLSVVLRPDIAPERAPPITLAGGLGVVDAVNKAGVHASLKWPNDVLVGGKKLAGVLTEMNTRGQELEHVILGIGVNVNAHALPPEIASIATSLRLELGREVEREDFLSELLPALERWLDAFFAGGVSALADAWTERAELSGSRVRAGAEDGPVEGEPVGLDDEGALLVEDDAGRRHRVVSGEVAKI